MTFSASWHCKYVKNNQLAQITEIKSTNNGNKNEIWHQLSNCLWMLGLVGRELALPAINLGLILGRSQVHRRRVEINVACVDLRLMITSSSLLSRFCTCKCKISILLLPWQQCLTRILWTKLQVIANWPRSS